jgi:RNA polymerase sigma factor (sigma-70 family)
MNDTDLELLKRYVRDHDEDAFAEIVRRHLELVYSAALRQVRCHHLAEEVAQSAFTDLARNAHRLARGGDASSPESLAPWLYTVTRGTAVDVVRREARRQAREQIATEMNAINELSHFAKCENTTGWTDIEPLLDEAVSALDDKDRAAILLRYFENKSLREVGATLGTSDDAAQKRVSRAVERLRELFVKRGIMIGASGLVVVISANAVQAAPVGLAVTISTAAALAGPTFATTATATTIKTIAMTTLQKTLVTATVAVLAGAGLYEGRQAAMLRSQNQLLQQQQAPLAEQNQQLTRERDEAAGKLAASHDENKRLSQNTVELTRLRAEVTRLRATQHQVAQLKDANDPFIQSVLALTARAAELNQYLERMADKNIPEIKLLRESDWLEVAREVNFQSEAEIRESLSKLRSVAKSRFGKLATHALDEYLRANNGQLPTDPSQLKPYFEVPVDDAVLQRYRMLHSGNVNDLPKDTIYVISEKAPVDRDYDSHFYVGPHGRSGSWGTGRGASGDPDPDWTNR